jgi:hypothetical protein
VSALSTTLLCFLSIQALGKQHPISVGGAALTCVKYVDEGTKLASITESDMEKLEALLEIVLHFSVFLQNRNEDLVTWYSKVGSPQDLNKRRETIQTASVINTQEHLNDAKNYLEHLSEVILNREDVPSSGRTK